MNKVIFEGIEFIEPNKVNNIPHYHGIIHRDIRNGTIKRKPCEICGKKKGHAHHEYYAESDYKVRWLCHKHHKMLHGIFTKSNHTYANIINNRIHEKRIYNLQRRQN